MEKQQSDYLDRELKKILEKALQKSFKKFGLFSSKIYATLKDEGLFHLDDKDFDLLFLNELIEYKNRFIEKAKSPLFGYYFKYFVQKGSEKLFVESLKNYISFDHPNLKQENSNSIINDLEDQLTEIMFLNRVIDYPKTMHDASSFNNLPNDFALYPNFEMAYLKEMHKEVYLLKKTNLFKEDYLFSNFYWNLNIVEVKYFYDFLKEWSLLDDDINFPKFAYLISLNNEDIIRINLKNSNFTEPDLGLLLYKFYQKYWNGSRRNYLNWLFDKFRIIPKRKIKKEKRIDTVFNDSFIRSYKGKGTKDPKRPNLYEDIIKLITTLNKLNK